ncbi:MAG: hypothetical protein AB8H79_04280 [Myxococcota bacterium]
MRISSLLFGLSALALTACNGAPLPPGIQLQPEAPTTVDDLVLSITKEAEDPNKNDEVQLAITWSVDGQPQADLDGVLTVPAARTKRDETWEVTIIPRDDKLDGETVTASLTILNSAPAVGPITVTPDGPTTDTDLTAAFDVSDVDEDAVTTAIAWSVNGTEAGTGDSLSSSLFVKGDSVLVEVTPNDGTIDGEVGTAGPFVIGNTPPSVTGAVITPETATVVDTLGCLSEGWADVDGDSEDSRIAWTVNGVAASSEATLTGDAFAKGDSVVCTLTPFDGEDEGAAVMSAELVVSNALPTVESVIIDQAAPAEGDTLTLTLGALSDADEDVISPRYAWFVNGAQVAVTETLSSDFFDRDDEVYVEVTPNDGEDDGATVRSAVVTVVNSAPVLTSVTLSPGSMVRTDDTLTAAWAATDADGDTLTATYVWTVDGTAIGATGSTLDGSTWFSKDESVNVTITVSDGTDTSATVSGTAILIENTPPTGMAVEIDPGAPSSDDDLLCDVTTLATDADGDTLTYTAEWTRDGSGWTGSTSTIAYSDDMIDAADTGDGDEWSCTMTVDDGDDSVDVTSSVVTVSNDVTFHLGYYWVKANYRATRSDHASVCSSKGLTATAYRVTLTWNAAALSQLSSDFGYTSAGDTSSSALSMWCFDADSTGTSAKAGECETHNFGTYYENYGNYSSGGAGLRPVFTCVP